VIKAQEATAPSSLPYHNPEQDSHQRSQMILDELPQVYYVAQRIREGLPQHVPFEDLVHEGVLGLINAAKNFDPTRNAQFKTYARFRIRGAILDSLREWDWSPRPLRRKERRIGEAIAKLGTALGRQPTDEEIAAELGMELKDFHKLLTRLGGLDLVGQNVNSAYDRSEQTDLIETAPGKDSENPFELYARSELKEILTHAISHLTKNEQIVVSLYYVEELTMKEIAAVLQLGESRISQLHSLALVKLRNALHNVPGLAQAGVEKT
jgi:RNA polymerase sigma factor for flagellar operon FliA